MLIATPWQARRGSPPLCLLLYSLVALVPLASHAGEDDLWLPGSAGASALALPCAEVLKGRRPQPALLIPALSPERVISITLESNLRRTPIDLSEDLPFLAVSRGDLRAVEVQRADGSAVTVVLIHNPFFVGAADLPQAFHFALAEHGLESLAEVLLPQPSHTAIPVPFVDHVSQQTLEGIEVRTPQGHLHDDDAIDLNEVRRLRYIMNNGLALVYELRALGPVKQ